MEREIKFKYYFLLNKKVINTKTFIMDNIEDINFNTLLFLNIDCNENNFENMELHRSQYTELKDKNDVEIYEGDIVELYLDGKYINNYICEFKNGCFMFKEIGSDWIGIITNTETEVIGNIYENPDLLQ